MRLPLRIIYAGTPDFAVPALQALIHSNQYEVVAVYSQPDRPAGRGRKLHYGPVKQVALDAGIPVEQPESLKQLEAQERLRDYQPDVMVVAAYGLILPQSVLDIPRYGCLNIHASLLPRWRGAAPIQRAIEAGDKTTGVTIMQMAAGLDRGDTLLKSSVRISPFDTGQTIHDQLATQGAQDLLAVLQNLPNLHPKKQDETFATYAHKLSKTEAEIDWSKPALDIDRMVRAFNPWPMAFTQYHGKPMKVIMSQLSPRQSSAEPGLVVNETTDTIEVACGDGVLAITRLQMPGKKAMDVSEFLHGHSMSSVHLGR